MKYIIRLYITLVLALLSIGLQAQVPQGIPYQAVARNASGQPLDNRSVKVRFSVIDSIAIGTAVYVESHSTVTNSLGLFSVNVGMGTPVNGSFNGIKWGLNSKFLKVELDTTASGNSFVDLGTQQMMSVPYALYAGGSMNGIPQGATQGQFLTFCNGQPLWTDGGQCPAFVSTLECSSISHTGAVNSLVSCQGVSFSINYTGGNGGPYPAQVLNSSGVSGLIASLTSGSVANGSGSITYTISGIPDTCGTAIFNLNFGGKYCTVNRIVGNGLNGFSVTTCGAVGLLNPSSYYGNVVDIDGNNYKTVIIGNDEWMAENLKSAHFENGDPIQLVSSSLTWSNLTTSAYCWYNNDSLQYNCARGKLYNGWAASDTRNVCPSGWHVPTDLDWGRLVTALGGSSIAGDKMKSTGSIYWPLNGNSTNSSGFSAIPAGRRFVDGSFFYLNDIGFWWTPQSYSYFLVYSPSQVNRSLDDLRMGFSIRCVKSND